MDIEYNSPSPFSINDTMEIILSYCDAISALRLMGTCKVCHENVRNSYVWMRHVDVIALNMCNVDYAWITFNNTFSNFISGSRYFCYWLMKRVLDTPCVWRSSEAFDLGKMTSLRALSYMVQSCSIERCDTLVEVAQYSYLINKDEDTIKVLNDTWFTSKSTFFIEKEPWVMDFHIFPDTLKLIFRANETSQTPFIFKKYLLPLKSWNHQLPKRFRKTCANMDLSATALKCIIQWLVNIR